MSGTESAATTATVYQSTVTQVGGQVEAFLSHGLLIFFGAGSPAELHDISVLHEADVADDGPRPGDTVLVGSTSLEVLAVGDVVRDNLLNLGHLDLKADGRTEAKLPGDVCVRKGDLPLLAVGDTFRISRSPDSPKAVTP
ncbi:PTS glucitol/sorbitol transporter subunit IIA [Nocardioides sp. cx-169]|uniref:PTS glucitol/sorbitol transporter subunit IIA n=1 Tax=Nocardioides sp. cx-169 TaxID=2899080 RepID=UPI001E29E323|nr:PTS glucitol/sorbitol transporter subunit IIA [Nocardioides sp. cx-169]MCD4533813.1 PTS glucitol/sorbitol transporter subunit IIA [Nocardioides sp. cx-169]